MPVYESKAEAALRLENRHLRNELAKAWHEAEALKAEVARQHNSAQYWEFIHGQKEDRIAELETEVARLQREREDMRIGRMEECESLRAEAVKAVRRAEEAEREADALRAALEHITRECGALNKGPVAVEIARAALNHYNGNKEQ
jgi:predicted  nucleic acid-binding Zn-ribbon protein